MPDTTFSRDPWVPPSGTGPHRAARALLPLLILLAFLGPRLGAQESKTDDPEAVRQALRKGAGFLALKYWRSLDKANRYSNAELVLLAMSRAGVASEQSGFFQKVQEDLESLPLAHTYRVALLAMTLGTLDPVRYRARIAHCAQWLVDTQMEDGEWSYGLSTPIEAPLPTPEPEGSSPTARSFPIRKHSLTVTRKDKGDISNTQFALLGLQACADAGMEIPRSTWESAYTYFKTTQAQDGGWGYWIGDTKPDVCYASITFAGVASLALCHSAMGRKEFAEDPSIRAGLKWIDATFDPLTNTNISRRRALACNWEYFYLFCVERVGTLLHLRTFREKDWKSAGVKYILEHQRENGSWCEENDQPTRIWDRETVDTCFAMLFLSRVSPSPLRNPAAPLK